jgi:hypothetical protein
MGNVVAADDENLPSRQQVLAFDPTMTPERKREKDEQR